MLPGQVTSRGCAAAAAPTAQVQRRPPPRRCPSARASYRDRRSSPPQLDSAAAAKLCRCFSLWKEAARRGRQPCSRGVSGAHTCGWELWQWDHAVQHGVGGAGADSPGATAAARAPSGRRRATTPPTVGRARADGATRSSDRRRGGVATIAEHPAVLLPRPQNCRGCLCAPPVPPLMLPLERAFACVIRWRAPGRSGRSEGSAGACHHQPPGAGPSGSAAPTAAAPAPTGAIRAGPRPPGGPPSGCNQNISDSEAAIIHSFGTCRKHRPWLITISDLLQLKHGANYRERTIAKFSWR